MRRPLAVILTLAAALSTAALATPGAAVADPAGLDITAVGNGTTTYPAFDPDVHRYAVTTTGDTAGSVTIDVANAADGDTVRIDGSPAPEKTRTLTGLTAGDEISVLLTHAGTTTPYSFVYLPVGFPRLERNPALTGAPSTGLVMLTLAKWLSPSDFYETAVDANGVPAWVHANNDSLDLKPLAGGGYSVARGLGDPTGYDVVELDSQFREVRRHHTASPVSNTDSHDSVLMPDGSIYLLSYEPNADTGLTDAVVQQVSASGQALFTWNSKDHVDIPAETVVGSNPDYAHVNSIQVLPDGDLLVSFRHFSSAFKIARTAHDGYAAGDVIWKFGGRDSSFTFTNKAGDPDGGPCAQHTVYQVAPDRLLTFDNGSGWPGAPMCIDPADPHGSTFVSRGTRVAEWELDVAGGTAHEVWQADEPGRFALFAGSAQRLTSGHTMIGWAADTTSIATEVDADGEPVWELRDPAASQRFFTYRADEAPVPDAIKPTVTVATPTLNAAYPMGATVTPAAECTDRGGSSLTTCTVPALSTAVPGTHTYSVTATDGAGNTTTVQRSYRVLSPGRPDAMIRHGGTSYVGRGVVSWPAKSRVTLNLPKAGSRGTVVVRVTNNGDQPARFTLDHTAATSRFRISVSGSPSARMSPVLQPGQSWTLRATVTRTKAARAGNTRDFAFLVRSSTASTYRDAIAVRARAVKPAGRR